MATMREFSKQEWQGERLEHINAGSLQRIADACESMAKNHDSLVRQRDMYLNWYNEEQSKAKQMQRTIRALKGAITKLKKRGE